MHARFASKVDTAKRALARLDRARTFGVAAEMAFWFFLAMVPLAAVAGLVLAKVAESHWGAIAPRLEGLPPAVAGFVKQQLDSVAAWNGGSVGWFAGLVFVWLASSGVQAIFDGLEVQTGRTRPWWKKRLLALAACLGLSIGVALVAVVLAGAARIGQLAGGAVPALAAAEESIAGKAVRLASSALVYVALLAGLYRVGVPRGSLRAKTPVWPGAALAAALQIAMGYAYGLYVSTLGKASSYSGALWAIGVTMTALYLFAIAILLGAELNHQLACRRETRLDEAASRPSREPPPRASHAPIHARAR